MLPSDGQSLSGSCPPEEASIAPWEAAPVWLRGILQSKQPIVLPVGQGQALACVGHQLYQPRSRVGWLSCGAFFLFLFIFSVFTGGFFLNFFISEFNNAKSPLKAFHPPLHSHPLVSLLRFLSVPSTFSSLRPPHSATQRSLAFASPVFLKSLRSKFLLVCRPDEHLSVLLSLQRQKPSIRSAALALEIPTLLAVCPPPPHCLSDLLANFFSSPSSSESLCLRV